MSCQGRCVKTACCFCGKTYSKRINLGIAVVYGADHSICSRCVGKWAPNTDAVRTIRQLLFGAVPNTEKETHSHG